MYRFMLKNSPTIDYKTYFFWEKYDLSGFFPLLLIELNLNTDHNFFNKNYYGNLLTDKRSRFTSKKVPIVTET